MEGVCSLCLSGLGYILLLHKYKRPEGSGTVAKETIVSEQKI